MSILPQTAGVAKSTSALISLPVLEDGGDCPAGRTEQWARSEDNPTRAATYTTPEHCCLQWTGDPKWIFQTSFSPTTSFNVAFSANFVSREITLTPRMYIGSASNTTVPRPPRKLRSASLPYQGQRRFRRRWWSLTSSIKTLNYVDTAHKSLNEGLPDSDAAWAEWRRVLPVR